MLWRNNSYNKPVELGEEFNTTQQFTIWQAQPTKPQQGMKYSKKWNVF